VLAQERYSWEGIAQRLSEIYEGIVESPQAFAA
jgi:glycosyltransferase involved in cell wall biosynthesis